MSIRRHLDHRRLIGVHIVLSLFTLSPGTPASDMIYTGGNLTDGNTLVSAGGSFTLGFFSPPGEPTKRYLGTWFFFSPSPDAMAIYWVANRDHPLTDTTGVLVLTNSGTLLLLDGSNNTVWSSGSTSSTPPTGARLLESGNLVVVQHNNSTAQWQSFDHPCNALLPGMKIGQNLWNGDEWYLSSWRSATDPGTGSYRYITELGGGTPENVMWDSNGTKKYRTGPWNGERFDGVPEMASYASNFSYQVTISPSEATYSYTANPGVLPAEAGRRRRGPAPRVGRGQPAVELLPQGAQGRLRRLRSLRGVRTVRQEQRGNVALQLLQGLRPGVSKGVVLEGVLRRVPPEPLAQLQQQPEPEQHGWIPGSAVGEAPRHAERIGRHGHKP
jgi:hypothetical protein